MTPSILILRPQAKCQRRTALLLEVLIAMALLSVGIGMLFRGPLLLLKAESEAVGATALEWELDRQFMLMMCQLLEKGPDQMRSEPWVFQVRAGNQQPLQGQIDWTVYREVRQEQDSAALGGFYRIVAKVSVGKRTVQRQRSIFIEDPL